MSEAYHGEEGPVIARGLAGQDVLRLALLSFAALIAVALAVAFFLDAGRQAAETAGAEAPASAAPPEPPAAEPLALARGSIEKEIARDAPDYAVFFARLQSALPSQYDAILDDFAKELLDGKDVRNVDSCSRRQCARCAFRTAF